MHQISPVRRATSALPAAASAIPVGAVWHTVAETARYARCSTRTVHRAIHNGDLATEQRGKRGAHHRIHIDAIEAWIRGEPAQRLRPTG